MMLRIVLVEDNPADARILQTAFARAGGAATTIVIENGRDAIEYFSVLGPDPLPCDIALMDLNLPQVSGFEVLEAIRASESLRGLPVVVMSGSSSQTDVDRCYRAGANSYICKPIHLDDIFAMAVRFVTYWTECVKLPAVPAGERIPAGVL
jgi:CheY-like chemotaxis protein